MASAPLDEEKPLTKKELRIIDYWKGMTYKPKCIVFDLDYTLWPFLIDHQVLPPFRKIKHNDTFKIFDHNNREIQSYEDIHLIINTLVQNCFKNGEFLCIASRATFRESAMSLLDLLDLTKHFSSIQIYSGTKQKHMKQIQKDLKFNNFDNILFFDDSKLNIETTQSLGVIAHQVTRHYGLSVDEFLSGLKKYNLHFCKSN